MTWSCMYDVVMRTLTWDIRALPLLLTLLTIYIINAFWFSVEYVLPINPPLYDRFWSGRHTFYNLSLLDEHDSNSLINKTDFRYLLNYERCNDTSDLLFLVFVHSSPGHFGRRRAIRDTWGNESLLLPHDPVRVIFLLGETSDPNEQLLIEQEHTNHRDIVQGNFLDSYRNLTYKYVMGLKWVSYYCRQARFIFKTDDDIFIDIIQMADFVKTNFGFYSSKKLLFCFLYRRPLVKRTRRSKWFVSAREYRGNYYPPYCAGWAVVMSPDVVFDLYLESTRSRYFWVDDVHVTGVLAERIDVKQIDFNDYFSISEYNIQEWLDSSEIIRPYMYSYPFPTEVNDLYTLWNRTLVYYNLVQEVNS